MIMNKQFQYRYGSIPEQNALLEAMTPTESMIVSVDNECVMFENDMDNILEPYKPGIYMVGSSEPLVCEDNPGFSDVHGNPVITMEDLKGLDPYEVVVNSNGDIIIGHSLLNTSHSLLSDTPTVPARTYGILKTQINHEIIKLNPYRDMLPLSDQKYHYTNDVISPYCLDYVKPEYWDDFRNNNIDFYRYFGSIIDTVIHYVGNKNKYIYMVSIDRGDLYIGRSIDVRAYRYMIEKELSANHE